MSNNNTITEPEPEPATAPPTKVGGPLDWEGALTLKQFLILQKALEVATTSQLNHCEEFLGRKRIFIPNDEIHALRALMKDIVNRVETDIMACEEVKPS